MWGSDWYWYRDGSVGGGGTCLTLLVSQLFFGASVQVGMTLSLHIRIYYTHN